jgi:2-polyprenyl-6-methoxyphenol hydroxylase-like FAD-dependent oxidoreductase
MAGLFAALLLRRAGWAVDVFERANAELSGRGAGIVTHAELRAVLTRAGVDHRKNLGVAVQGRKTLDPSGKVIATFDCPQIVTSWDRVFRMLRDAFPADRYHLGKELSRIQMQDHSVTAHFADGTTTQGAVLAGADGFRSSVRAQIMPHVSPVYAGYIAWRGLVDESALSKQARAELFDCLAFCLPPNEQFLGYPVAGQDNDLREGHRRYNIIWYRPSSGPQLQDLLTDESGHTHPISIPPNFVRRDIVDGLRAAARALLPPQFQEAINLTPQPFLQPIYDVESPCMIAGRIALLGDAAFVGRPHVAAGVTKAAEDALALATALQRIPDVPRALQSFEQARLLTNNLIVQRGRELGLYFRPDLLTREGLQRAAQHHTPEAVMSEIAILDFLHGKAQGN